jgi:hypothetical protein
VWRPEAISKVRLHIAHIGCQPLLRGRANRRDGGNRCKNYGEPAQVSTPVMRFEPVPSENLIRWIRSGKEKQIMIETDGDLLQTLARTYVGLLSFA